MIYNINVTGTKLIKLSDMPTQSVYIRNTFTWIIILLQIFRTLSEIILLKAEKS